MAQCAQHLLRFVVTVTAFAAISSSANALPLNQSNPVAGVWIQHINNVDYDDYYAHEQLEKLLRPHFFFGDRVSDAVRAATGDPNISVIDRRFEFGEVYECNFQFWGLRKQRVMVCD